MIRCCATERTASAAALRGVASALFGLPQAFRTLQFPSLLLITGCGYLARSG